MAHYLHHFILLPLISFFSNHYYKTMIGIIGISYKTAPVEKREKFTFLKEEIVPFADFLQQETDISDIVLVSTCNRTELYFSQTKYDKLTATDKVIAAIKNFKNAECECSRYFYYKFDSDAVKHLFTVAAGLDSMIIGEDQIIGQIKDAYLNCTNAALTDAVLMRLFQKSFEAGKRARTETGIKLGNLSVSSTAVELCTQQFGELNNKSVLIVGSGDTGSLALQNMVKRGIGQSTIINRTKKKAEPLAEKFNSRVSNYLNIEDELGMHDIVITATGAPHYIITETMVKKAAATRRQIFIDLSMPRNIEETIAEFDNIQLYAIDDLQNVIDQNTENRKKSAEKAELIINQITDEFNEWMISRSLRPAIRSISKNLNAVHKQELESFRHFDSTEVKDAVHQYTKHIVSRYTRLLIKNLKDITDNGKKTHSLEIINDLFQIEDINRRED